MTKRRKFEKIKTIKEKFCLKEKRQLFDEGEDIYHIQYWGFDKLHWKQIENERESHTQKCLRWWEEAAENFFLRGDLSRHQSNRNTSLLSPLWPCCSLFWGIERDQNGETEEWEGVNSRLGHLRKCPHFMSQLSHWLYLHYITSLTTLLFSVFVVHFFSRQTLHLFYFTLDCLTQTVVLILCHISLWCESDDLFSLTSLQGWILLLVSQIYIIDFVFHITGINRSLCTTSLSHMNSWQSFFFLSQLGIIKLSFTWLWIHHPLAFVGINLQLGLECGGGIVVRWLLDVWASVFTAWTECLRAWQLLSHKDPFIQYHVMGIEAALEILVRGLWYQYVSLRVLVLIWQRWTRLSFSHTLWAICVLIWIVWAYIHPSIHPSNKQTILWFLNFSFFSLTKKRSYEHFVVSLPENWKLLCLYLRRRLLLNTWTSSHYSGE